MKSSTITIRLQNEELAFLEKHSKSLKIPPSTFAKELVLNGLYSRKDKTLLSAFQDSEKRNKEETTSVKQRLSSLESRMDNHLYGVATAVFLFLSRDDESDEERQETKEYVRQIFPFWRG